MTMLFIGATLVGVSLFISFNMAQTLREKEKHDVELWASAMERVNRDAMSDYIQDPLIRSIINNRNNIPFIITDEKLNPVSCHLIPDKVKNNPELMRLMLDRMARVNTPIVIKFWWTTEHNHIMFYGLSTTLRLLYIFPIVQLIIIIAYFLAIYVAFNSTKQDEQKRVWIGLAKETAHQLGTPTSSLMGWIEYLRDQNVDSTAVDEMAKDITHLRKVVDRFSKIGSDTQLSVMNVNEIVGGCVMYFRSRIPKNVTIQYDGLAKEHVQAFLNADLFEWVIENLLKNALDAMQGHGNIDVLLGYNNRDLWVDVVDTGKGIARLQWKRIFLPGFTTKTRGWGLGLSLSRRIIEEYHHGRIAVVDSEIGKGTRIRITLKRAIG